MASGPFATILRQIRGLALSEDAARQEDARLLDRFLGQRDEAAFEALVRRHGPMVLGVCRRLLPDWCDVEDAFQATFLVLLRKAPSLGRRERVGPWLYGVARRTALRARRSAARRQTHEKQVAHPASTDDGDDVAWRDMRAVLDDELARLPEKYRAPVILCYLEGKTYNEAAELLGWPSGTVFGRLARARDLLRQRLTRRGLALSAGLLAVALAEKTSAAVPAALTASTMQVAQALVAGNVPAVAAVSSSAAALMEGVLQAMFLKQLKIVLAAVSLVLLVVVAGVLTHTMLAAPQADDTKEEKKADEPAPAGEPNRTTEEPARWGTVKGQVVFDGDPIPEPKPISVDKDQQHCQSRGPLVSNEWVVNKDNKGIRYAYVWLVADPNLKKPSQKIPVHPSLAESKEKQLVLDQPCCMFEPHVLALREDQTLTVKNSAPIPHNVNIQGGIKNPTLNVLLPPGGQMEVKDFKAAVPPVSVVCNIHGWMKSYIRVFDHPYFAITDADGKFEIKQAPAGDFYLVVWHEAVGWRDRKTVTNAEGKEEQHIGTKITIKGDGTIDLGKLGIKSSE
jgi:RNA polymerase sigma factor (sigma-70 family)